MSLTKLTPRSCRARGPHPAPGGDRMMTEDSIRRRELAGLGVKAEVVSDGHTVVATFDLPQFDSLIELAGAETYSNGYDEGCRDGFDDGYKAALRDIKTLAAVNVTTGLAVDGAKAVGS